MLPLVMLIVFVSAKLTSELFERLRMPGIAGEILAGVLIGPSVLGWVSLNDTLIALSDLGVMFFLFRVGLETRAPELLKVGGTAAIIAIGGAVVSVLLSWSLFRLWGHSQLESVFAAVALASTSVAISAKVLSSRGLISLRAGQIILTAAVIDDVIGLVALAVISSVARNRLQWLDLLLTAVLPLAFTWFMARWGAHAVKRAVPSIESRILAVEAQFHLSIILLFALSVLAMYTGVAAIVGAFLAGMCLAESVGQRVQDLAHGASELLVPFFLAGIGLRVELPAFKDASMILLAAALLAAAILSKIAGCGAGAWKLGFADAARVGTGMIPRGEVAMVVAQIGLTIGAMPPNVYGVVVLTALATTIVAPPLIALAFRSSAAPGAGLESAA